MGNPAGSGAASSPAIFDFFFLLVGAALSLYLRRIDFLHLDAQSAEVHTLVTFYLPALLRLGEGIILLWPLFLASQRVLGRPAGLTPAEWLWVVAWVGNVAVLSCGAVHKWGRLPDVLTQPIFWPGYVWYVFLAPALGLIGMLILIMDKIGRKARPWSHQLALALVFWPIPPFVLLLVWGKFARTVAP